MFIIYNSKDLYTYSYINLTMAFFDDVRTIRTNEKLNNMVKKLLEAFPTTYENESQIYRVALISLYNKKKGEFKNGKDKII